MELLKIQNNELSKDSLNNNIQAITEGIENGEIDALQAHLYFKAVQNVAKQVVDNTLSDAIAEADNYGKDNKKFGAEFSIKNSPDTLDYEQDEEYKRLNEQLKERKKLLNDAHKASQDGRSIIDESGEVVPVVPVKKHGGQTISVSFK